MFCFSLNTFLHLKVKKSLAVLQSIATLSRTNYGKVEAVLEKTEDVFEEDQGCKTKVGKKLQHLQQAS